MSYLRSVSSGVHEAASALTNAALQVLNGAAHPLRAARVMGRLVMRPVHQPGTPPGALIHTGARKMEEVRIRLMEYDPQGLKEAELSSVMEAFPIRDSSRIGWVNVDGLHDPEILREIRDHFGLHLLLMEDVASVGQRAKLDDYEDSIFLSLPMLWFHRESMTLEVEQLSLVLGPTWVLSFQERVGDVFDPVRERLRSAHGRIRSRGADYLVYALMDAVVDRYFSILEQLGDAAEELEGRVMGDPTSETLLGVNHLKRELLVLRKSVWPLREALGAFSRIESSLVVDSTQVFVRDVHDHVIQVIDTVETLRDLASGMSDLYLSGVAQRTNEVMKVLTVMASIFIPLTFLAGVYGMNFEYMPELGIRWAYPAVLGVMLALGVSMLWYFKKRKWL
jgi:magnesium transporter